MDYEKPARLFLSQYGIAARTLTLLGHSDKHVYKVTDDVRGDSVLSIYWPSGGKEYMMENPMLYERDSIDTEMRLMDRLSRESALETPAPIRNMAGCYVCEIGAGESPLYATLVTFIEGQAVEDKTGEYPEQCFYAGQTAARLHTFATRLPDEEAFLVGRPRLDREFIYQCTAMIERGVFAGTIPKRQFDALREAERIILDAMENLDARPDKSTGIIHTDLRAANFIARGASVIPIDFSRFAHGYFLYDLGEMCAHMGGEEIQKKILRGYRSMRPLDSADIKHIEAFFMMFLYSVLGEFSTQKDLKWLPDTINDMLARYIPAYKDKGFLPDITRECPDK